MRLAQLIAGVRQNGRSAKPLAQLRFIFHDVCAKGKALLSDFYLGIFARKFSGPEMNLGGNGTVWLLPRGG